MDRSYPRQLTGAACENVGNWKRDTRASAARLHTLIYCDLTFTPVTAAVRALVVNEGAHSTGCSRPVRRWIGHGHDHRGASRGTLTTVSKRHPTVHASREGDAAPLLESTPRHRSKG